MKKLSPKILISLTVCALLGVFAFFCKFVFPGYSFTALVCTALIAVILFYTFAPMLRKKYPVFGKWAMRIFTVCLVLVLLAALVTEGLILHASLGNPEEACDYLVVLGAKVNASGPSVSLHDRILAACEYMTAHPEVIAVVSGGQGPDEPMTEASCMYGYLTAMGIAPERIWVEDKATSTWENLQFSLDLIEARTGSRPEKLGVLSSEYHLFRASLFTKACGTQFIGIPAHTSRTSQMLNHFMREVAGVWHYLILGGLYHD